MGEGRTGGAWGDELPLSTIESFVAALVEAGPEVAEHMVRAANELLLAAQALLVAAERRLAEQRRLREEVPGAPPQPAEPSSGADQATGGSLRSVDEVA